MLYTCIYVCATRVQRTFDAPTKAISGNPRAGKSCSRPPKNSNLFSIVGGKSLHTMICCPRIDRPARSEEHTSELQSLMRISYAVFCLTKKHEEDHKR